MGQEFLDQNRTYLPAHQHDSTLLASPTDCKGGNPIGYALWVRRYGLFVIGTGALLGGTTDLHRLALMGEMGVKLKWRPEAWTVDGRLLSVGSGE